MSSNLLDAHKEWASRPADQRFQTLADLHASVANRRRLSKNRDCLVNDLVAFGDGGELSIGAKGTSLGERSIKASNWSFGQIAVHAGAPAAYLRSLPSQMSADLLNYGFKNSDSEVRLMTVSDDDTGKETLQAATSQSYGRIWDQDVVEATQRIVEASGGRFYNPLAYAGGKFGASPVPSGLYASDRDVFCFLIDGGSRLEVKQADGRAKLHRGFFVSNSEVGARTFDLTTFLFNEVCGNNIVWGAEQINRVTIRHSLNAPTRFDQEAMPALLSYVNASAETSTDAIGRACTLKLTDVVNVEKVDSDEFTATFSKRFGFTRGEVRTAVEYANREEGKCFSVWDMIQGLTASAREYAHLDARINLEARAGKLMSLAA